MGAEFDMVTGEWLTKGAAGQLQDLCEPMTPLTRLQLLPVSAAQPASLTCRLPPDLANLPVDALLRKF
jgi:hypothetical protein